MRTRSCHLPASLSRKVCFATLLLLVTAATHAAFTTLEPVKLKIAGSSEPYPGGNHLPANLVDGNTRSEFSSNAKGTNTFVEFDFTAPVEVAAFRHVDRNDPATIKRSELTLLDAAGQAVGSFAINHVNRRGGITTFMLPAPVTAQRARWQVTELGSEFSTVGGAEAVFFRRGTVDETPRAIKLNASLPQLLERQGQGFSRPARVVIDYPYAEPCEAQLSVPGADPKALELSFGTQQIEMAIPARDQAADAEIRLTAGSPAAVIQQHVSVKPVRKMEIYLLPHSHVDIGYTALQADVEKKQDENLRIGMRLARESADNPEGARFKWNVEVLWPVENYLRTAAPEERAQFIQAVKDGQVGLDAFYGNILTGLCRPEELLNLMSYATRLSRLCGVPIESAMISDVPGYTWSTVTAMAQAGVKYFSFAPNYFDRMGGTMKEWQNRPFWWKSPDGRQRVLCWCPSRGYALGHLIGDGEALARFIPDYLVELETNSYPYEITHLRWNVHGDNGSPDEKVAAVVRDWNVRYAYPRLIISTTAAAFRQFEKRYGAKLPEFSGDYTPYWEDGAASSALETALNRASAERLVQAAALWAMRNPGPFPAAGFQEAWRNVLLYSEHTWGAHNSISQPDIPFVRDQWRVKQGFALDADKQSRALLKQALGGPPETGAAAGAFDVFNTASWPRTDLVTVPPALAQAGDRVVDDSRHALPSQRLSTGELVFLARGIPAFGSRRFRTTAGESPKQAPFKVASGTITSPEFIVRIDGQSGAIQSLVSRSLGRELVKPEVGLNSYYYMPGSDTNGVKKNGPVTINIKERGPLLASLVVESDAPGCRKLSREIRLIAGLDRVEIIDLIDKLPVRAKEGLHLGFAFNVPDAMPRFDVGLAAVRPELDQIPAACKNWFSVQRWVDLSNDKFGVTWASVDAPLVELGGLTANLVGSQTDHRVWIQHLKPSSTIYSWVMNNHWHTNYRADQEGPTVFRFAIWPHKGFEPEAAGRFGSDCSQPLLVSSATRERIPEPRLKLSSQKVAIIALKPSDDGKGQIVRLFGASGRTEKVKLRWSEPQPREVWLSDTSEQPKQRAGDSLQVPGWGVVTVRAQ